MDTNVSNYVACVPQSEKYPVIPLTLPEWEYKFKSTPVSRSSKPGPKPNRCIWCNEVQCSHCQCPGYARCDHKNGEPCSRQRYKRRLVCNSCEKVKLREEAAKRDKAKETDGPTTTPEHPKLEKKASHSRKKKSSMFDILCEVASSEAQRLTVAAPNPVPVVPLADDRRNVQPVIVYPFYTYQCQPYPPNVIDH